MPDPWSDVSSLASQAAEAKQVYLDSLDPEAARQDWHACLDRVATEFSEHLQAAASTPALRAAIEASGSVTALLRQLTAPPLSQDQFKLLCPSWPKQSEKTGAPIPADRAESIANTFEQWLDPRIIAGISENRAAEVAAAPLYALARQRYETERRNNAARSQETQVIELLVDLGYTEQARSEIEKPWEVEQKCFTHKTILSAADKATAEVDLAVALAQGRMLAVECKVSNDATNSIKRVNDILKKREAWNKGYGQVLTTGAVLQGVFASKDIERLAHAGVVVFFSHDLTPFRQFLESE